MRPQANLLRVARKLLPRNQIGDNIIALLEFREANGRWPSRDGSLNDSIHYLKTGAEALNPLRSQVADKVGVKQYVREKVGDQFNVPTLNVLSTLREIDEFAFPEDCVIKPTHMSGQVIMRKAGSPIDFDRIRIWMESNYYRWTREIFYKRLQPRVIVEPFIFGSDNVEDYKIFCVGGEPRLMWVDIDRHTRHRRNLYTPDWRFLPAAIEKENGPAVSKPKNLGQMLDLARRLSAPFNYIRVDLYSNGQQILVGELTNSSGNAQDRVLHGEDVIARQLFPRGLREFLAGGGGCSKQDGNEVRALPLR